jgi:hypothetical protein
MMLNEVAHFQQGKKLLNPYVISELELWTGEILPEEWFVAIICKRGDNSAASAASQGDVQLLISCLHYEWH